MVPDKIVPVLLQQAVEKGLITRDQMSKCLAEKNENRGKNILAILVEKGFPKDRLDELVVLQRNLQKQPPVSNWLPEIEEESIEEDTSGILMGSLELTSATGEDSLFVDPNQLYDVDVSGASKLADNSEKVLSNNAGLPLIEDSFAHSDLVDPLLPPIVDNSSEPKALDPTELQRLQDDIAKADRELGLVEAPPTTSFDFQPEESGKPTPEIAKKTPVKQRKSTQSISRQKSNTPFGKAAILLHMATQQQVDDALASQNAECKGKLIGEIMVQKGYLAREQVQLILSRQRTKLMLCPQCEKRYHIVLFQEGRTYKCKKCEIPLITRAEYKKRQKLAQIEKLEQQQQQTPEKFQVIGLTQAVPQFKDGRYDTRGLDFIEEEGQKPPLSTEEQLREVGFDVDDMEVVESDPLMQSYDPSAVHRQSAVHSQSAVYRQSGSHRQTVVQKQSGVRQRPGSTSSNFKEYIGKGVWLVVIIAVAFGAWQFFSGSTKDSDEQSEDPKTQAMVNAYQKIDSPLSDKDNEGVVKKRIKDYELFQKNYPDNPYRGEIQDRLAILYERLDKLQVLRKFREVSKNVGQQVSRRRFAEAQALVETVAGEAEQAGLSNEVEILLAQIVEEKKKYLQDQYAKVDKKLSELLDRNTYDRAMALAQGFATEAKGSSLEEKAASLVRKVEEKSRQKLQKVFAESDSLLRVRQFRRALGVLQDEKKHQTPANIESLDDKIKSLEKARLSFEWASLAVEISQQIFPLLQRREYERAAAYIRESEKKYGQFADNLQRWQNDILAMGKVWQHLQRGFSKITRRKYTFTFENGKKIEGNLFRMKGESLILSVGNKGISTQLRSLHTNTISDIITKSPYDLDNAENRWYFMLFLATWKFNFPFVKELERLGEGKSFYEQIIALYFWHQAKGSLKKGNINAIRKFLEELSRSLPNAKALHYDFAEDILQSVRNDKRRKKKLNDKILQWLVKYLPETPAAQKALQELEQG